MDNDGSNQTGTFCPCTCMEYAAVFKTSNFAESILPEIIVSHTSTEKKALSQIDLAVDISASRALSFKLALPES